MWTLIKPAYTADESFEACSSRIRNRDLRTRMERIADTIADASDDYDRHAEQGELHLVATATDVDGEVTVAEMVRLYTGRMVPKDSPGRSIYDAIMALANHERCPFCGHRSVATLDHLLSKTQYPALTVTPNNLVPCCSDCNKAKLNRPPLTAADQYLHPYFDAIEDNLWLRAEIVETAPAAARFFVDPHPSWSQLTINRVDNHFRQLGLARLYSSQAAAELVNVRFQVAALFEKGGLASVKLFLEETHASRSQARVNSWQTAFYAALSESDWYCEGGFE